MTSKTPSEVIPVAECKRFITDCLLAVGAPKKHAEATADMLSHADYIGHNSHGIHQLEKYLSEIQNGLCRVDAVPSIIREKAATACVDGHNGLGVVVSNYCMHLAIEKARKYGIGMVVCKGSNHYGIASYYAEQAAKKGLIGMSFSNTSPVVAPTRTKHAALGSNPLSLVAPALQEKFLLDMATSTVASGRVEILRRNNTPVPKEWIHADTGALRPLGGIEENSSYKGFGITMLVEILCGILGDGAYGPNIRMFGTLSKLADLSHCFIALDPEAFAPGFENRLYDLITSIRGMEPIDPKKPVMIHGDKEKLYMKAVDEMGGLSYIPELLQSCARVAESLDVQPLRPKPRKK